MRQIRTEPLSAAAFAPFGDVLEASGDFRLINAGLCRRHHDRALMDFGPEGRAGISIFKAEARALPYEFDLIERHPDGSQAFLPMTADPFLDIVAESPASKILSKELKAAGFNFCGPTIVYAFMQAVGMVNDHMVTCFRHRELGG